MVDVIVIGGGPAGVTAALRARELGASVALLERGQMGGVCTNDGCVPTRVLAKAARLLRDAEQYESYGIEAAPPTINFERLMTRVQSVVYKMHEKKQLAAFLEKAGVTVHVNAGETSFVDAHTLQTTSGLRLEGDKIIICAGGHGRRLPFPGSELALTHQDVWSLKRQPRSLAVVGGAATGSQVASIFASFGTQVHLLEVSPRILAREDRLISQVISQSFERHGIQVVTGISGVERIEQVPGGVVLHYTRAGESHALPVDAVMLSVGWVGNLEALNLEAAGVRSERGYIVVNDYFQTSSPNIFAAGDITGRMMLVQSGSYEGRMAAENAVLGAGQPYQHQIVPHGGFTDPEYASVGVTEEESCKNDGACLVSVVPFANVDRAVIDGYTEGFCKLIVSQETHRILGAHVVGEQAVEIVQLIATAMAADMWIEQLAELELAYPTYTAVVGLAARRLMRDLGVTPLASGWRMMGEPNPAEWERRGL